MLHSERLPVADNLTTCLNKAIDVVKSVEGLDDDAQTLIVDRLRKAARNKELSDEDRIISVEQAILNARRDIVQAAVARKRQTEVLEGWAEDSRFRFGEGADELETAATNFKRLISADRGNQGIANESTVAAELRFELRQVLGRLEPVFRGIVDTRGYLRDSELAVKFHAETVGVDTGNAEAKRLAGLFHEAMQPYLERLQEAGIWVDVTRNWFFQSHDFDTINSNLDAWRTFMRENLDPEQHPDVERATEALYNSLIDRDIVEQTAGRVGMQRVFQFKSPEAQHEYFLRFGDGKGNVGFNVLNAASKISQETVIAERLGPGGMATYNDFADTLANAATRVAKTDRQANKLKKKLNRGRDVLTFMARPPTHPENQGIENCAAFARQWGVTQFLGKTALSLVGEEPILGVMFGRMASGGYFKSFTNRLSRVIEAADKHGVLRTLAESNGLFQSAYTSQNAGRTFAEPLAGRTVAGRTLGETARNFSAQTATFIQRYTGTIVAEQAQRTASWATLHDGIVRQLGKSWDDLSGSQFREFILERNGITRQDWEALQKQDFNTDVGFIDVERLARQAPKLHRKYMTMAVREAEIQTNLPDIESLMFITGVSDNVTNRAARQILTQFFGWAWSIQRNGIAREWQAGVAPRTVMVGSSLAAAVVTLQLYAAAGGQPLFEWDSPTLWTRALRRSAFAGPFVPGLTDLVAGDASSVAGVVPSTLNRMGSTLVRGGKAVLDDDMDKATLESIKFAEGFIPNWWQVDWLTSHAMDSAMENLDPQSVRRRNRRWEREQRMGQ